MLGNEAHIFSSDVFPLGTQEGQFFSSSPKKCSDYYGFGLIMPGRSNTTANANDLYKYTSHERDDEAVSDALDYMLARNYDPTLGRMNQIDPMAHVYSGISPYAYALNTPMNAIDPDGRLVIFVNGFPFDGYIGQQYWNNAGNGFFADQIMNHFPDEQARYFDGSRVYKSSLFGRKRTIGISERSKLGRLASLRRGFGNSIYRGNISTGNRVRAGRVDGNIWAANIASLIDSKNGETLKIFTHSMGAAYARGLVDALLSWMKNNPDQAFQIEFIADLAPYQAWNLKNPSGIPVFQSSGANDWIANGNSIGSISLSEGGTHFLDSFNADLLIQEITEMSKPKTVILVGLPGISVKVYD